MMNEYALLQERGGELTKTGENTLSHRDQMQSNNQKASLKPNKHK
jgi:hypothetical protein